MSIKRMLVFAALCAAMLLSLCACNKGDTVSVPDSRPVSQGVTAETKTIDADEYLAGTTPPAYSAMSDDEDDGGGKDKNKDKDKKDDADDEDDPDETDLDTSRQDEDDPDDEDPDDFEPDADGDDDEDEDESTGQSGSSTKKPGGNTSKKDDEKNDDKDEETSSKPSTSSGRNKDKGSFSSSGYRYQKYVLKQAGTGNSVFSGEALMSELSMWGAALGDSGKSAIVKYVGRDYLSFVSANRLDILNKIWMDESIDLGSDGDEIEDFVEYLDMASSDATGEKDAWVSKKTKGYIESTPSELDEDTLVDVMSVLYLHDTWATGTKSYLDRVRRFYNADGSETRTLMFWDEGLTYWDMGNALAYCMYLDGGDYVMFIVPNEDVSPSDVDVAPLMSGEIKSSKAHVVFTIPQFETESTFKFSLSDFNLKSGAVNPAVISGGISKSFEPSFTQVSKMTISPFGAGHVDDEDMDDFDVESAPTKNDYDDDLPFKSIVCDHPFLYYIGDSENEDVAFFGVVNEITKDMAVTKDSLGLSGGDAEEE